MALTAPTKEFKRRRVKDRSLLPARARPKRFVGLAGWPSSRARRRAGIGDGPARGEAGGRLGWDGVGPFTPEVLSETDPRMEPVTGRDPSAALGPRRTCGDDGRALGRGAARGRSGKEGALHPRASCGVAVAETIACEEIQTWRRSRITGFRTGVRAP